MYGSVTESTLRRNGNLLVAWGGAQVLWVASGLHIKMVLVVGLLVQLIKNDLRSREMPAIAAARLHLEAMTTAY